MKTIKLTGVVLDDEAVLTLNEVCCACSSSAEWVIELVDEGVIEPINAFSTHSLQTPWVFSGHSLLRAKTARRLQKDLDINLSGIALALDLLDEIKSLENQIQEINLSSNSRVLR